MENPASKKVPSNEGISFLSLREQMVDHHIAARGVRDELLLDAMRKVPRELFVPERLREFAYEDAPLPIAEEQTISQPYIVAFMVEALLLKGNEKVLEIGAGSGYAAAVLSEIVADVYTVERLGPLAEKAAVLLASSIMTTFTSCMATAQRDGLSTRLMMRSSWLLAGRGFRRLSSSS